jgi:hypothetical protein
MPITSQLAAIREMKPEDLQEHSDALYAKCDGNSMSLSSEEQRELLACSVNYFQLTGQPIPPASQLA